MNLIHIDIRTSSRMGQGVFRGKSIIFYCCSLSDTKRNNYNTDTEQMTKYYE